MKKNLITLVFFLVTFSLNAQSLDYTTWQSHNVITPTLKNLITIVDCSDNQFASLMKRYGYWESKDIEASDYTHQIFENNSLDFYLDNNDGLGANYIELSETYRHAQIFGRILGVYPKNALVQLRSSLKPYFKDRTSEGIDRFVIPDKGIGGYLVQIQMHGRTHYNIHIQHFSKLH